MSNATLVHGTEQPQIGGYNYGRDNVAHSSLTLEELHQLEQTVGWTEEDVRVLQRHGDIFRENADKMVSAWREVIGSQPHLVKWFFGPDGTRDAEYAEKVKKRFVQWVLDSVFRPHDRAWLDYQEEIGLRHTPEKKNHTDNAHTPPVVPLRYLLGFITVITIATRKILHGARHSRDRTPKIGRCLGEGGSTACNSMEPTVRETRPLVASGRQRDRRSGRWQKRSLPQILQHG
jgi:hypothetical protein